jgi:hypothetical protein
MTDWQDMIVGDRIAVDNEFSARVDESEFTRQEWGLIMTATTFEIESASDEAAATLVADTSELPTMMPEIEKVADMTPMGHRQKEQSGGGLFDTVLSRIGLGGSSGDSSGFDEEKLDAAEALVDAYAQELQTHLEANGRWTAVRTAAASELEGE